ncbi:MAG: hypothetical protein SFX73_07655 [Kofleriaceae bacterium]|nr:hypothetical protein [Kofleriaceae bacterium]
MFRSFIRRSWIVLALVPALAIAAPKGKKSKASAKKTKTITPAEPSEPTPPPSAPPEATPAAASTPPSTAPSTPAPPSGGAGGNGAGSGAGGGAGAPIPEPTEPAASGDPDVDTLRQEYLALRDELFKSRARASTVASQLYSTRIQIKLTYTTARFYNPAKASIRLDGASVYENTTGAIGIDDGLRFDGYVAPGRHLLTFRVEATGKDDDSFTSVTETQIVVQAVAGKDLVVSARAKDGGDIAYEWKKSQKGTYGLGIDVAVKTTARADAGATK